MFCYNCGANLPNEAKFCSECGQKLSEPETNNIQLKINDDQFKRIVMTHAFGAASAGMASGWIPGAGSTVAVATGLGFIFSMYARLSNYLEVDFSKNKLKVFGTSAISILSLAALNVAAGTALSFIPGLGSVAASFLAASVAYANVSVSATIFKKVILNILKSGKDISTLSEEELQEYVKMSMSKDEVKKAFKQAQSEFKLKKDSGEFQKAEKATVMEEFDTNNVNS